MLRRWVASLLVVAAGSIGQVSAQSERPARIVVSTAPGGASDIVARLLAERLAPLWKTQVLIDNRPGGGGVIAAEAVARAAGEGLVLGQLGSTLALNPAIRTDLRFDTLRDLRAVMHFGSAPAVLAARADFPANTPAELFALVRAQPGRFAYGSPGASTNGHRAMEALKLAERLDVTHVPYKSGAAATTDLLGGQIGLLMATPTAFAQHIRSGRLKAIAATGAKRFANLPNVPTFAESGVAGFDHVEWWLIVAPASAPQATIERIHRDLATVIGEAEFHKRLLDLDIETFVTSVAESDAFLRREIARWAASARALGLAP